MKEEKEIQVSARDIKEFSGIAGEVTLENLWDLIVDHQGETFYTAKKLPFTYTVKESKNP